MDLFDLTLDLQRRGLGMPLLMRFSDILHSRVQAAVRLLRRRDPRVRLPRPLPRRLPDQGQPAAPGGRGTGALRRAVRPGARGRLQARAAGRPRPARQPGRAARPATATRTSSTWRRRCSSQKLGRYPIVVIDRFRELDLLLQVARRLGIRPHIGVRGKLTTKGAGKWMESTGDRSKFGLTATEIVMLLDKLRERADARLPRAAALPHRLADLGGARHQGRDAGGLPHLRRAGARRARGSGSSTSAAAWAWTTTARPPTGPRPPTTPCRSTPTTWWPRSRTPARRRRCRTPTSSPSRAARWWRTTRCWCSTSWT